MLDAAHPIPTTGRRSAITVPLDGRAGRHPGRSSDPSRRHAADLRAVPQLISWQSQLDQTGEQPWITPHQKQSRSFALPAEGTDGVGHSRPDSGSHLVHKGELRGKESETPCPRPKNSWNELHQ